MLDDRDATRRRGNATPLARRSRPTTPGDPADHRGDRHGSDPDHLVRARVAVLPDGRQLAEHRPRDVGAGSPRSSQHAVTRRWPARSVDHSERSVLRDALRAVVRRDGNWSRGRSGLSHRRIDRRPQRASGDEDRYQLDHRHTRDAGRLSRADPSRVRRGDASESTASKDWAVPRSSARFLSLSSSSSVLRSSQA